MQKTFNGEKMYNVNLGKQTMGNKVLLGVNVDHVATLRNARGTYYPDPYQAAVAAQQGGADGITIHLREDRRHIIDADVQQFCANPMLPINLEMAATPAMQNIALAQLPAEVCLVPEKREELTTEGGLDVLVREAYLRDYVLALSQVGIKVSLFIDPDIEQIDAAKRVGADIIELHTGAYAEHWNAAANEQGAEHAMQQELARLVSAAEYAAGLGLVVNAGHGLTVENVAPIATIREIHCLNIGHALIAQAVFLGIEGAVAEMVAAIASAR